MASVSSTKPHAQLAAFGKAVREARIREGFSASDIASQAGLSTGRLRELERGLLDADYDLILRVGDAIGVRSSAIFRRAEELEQDEPTTAKPEAPRRRKAASGPPRRIGPRNRALAALAEAIEGVIADDPRLSRGIVATRTGLNDKQIGEYVRGQGNPTYTTLLKLAEEGLRVSLPALILRAHELRARAPEGGQDES